MTYREARALFEKIKTLPDYRNRVVVRMSELKERPTFNPQSRYKTTPPGTYAYPLGFVLDIGGGGDDFVDFVAGITVLPYASHAQWVHLFYIKDMECFLNLGDKNDIENFLKKYAAKNRFINTIIEYIRMYQHRIDRSYTIPILNRYLVGMPYENISPEEFQKSFNSVYEKIREKYIDSFMYAYNHVAPDEALITFVNDLRNFIYHLGNYYAGAKVLEVGIARMILGVFGRQEMIYILEAMMKNAPGEITSTQFRNQIPSSDSRSFSAFAFWFATTHRLVYYAFNKGTLKEGYLEESATYFVDMLFTFAFSKEKLRSSLDTFFRLLIDTSGEKGVIKSYRIYKELGYCGIYDPGTGGVHEAEPAQVVWWNPSAVEYLGVVPNIGMRERKIQNLKNYITSLDVIRVFFKTFLYRHHILNQTPRLFEMSVEDIVSGFEKMFYRKEFVPLFEKGLRMVSRFIKTGDVNQLRSLIHDIIMLHLRKDLLTSVSATYGSYSPESYYNEELKNTKKVVGYIADNMAALLTNYALDILTGKEQIKDIDSAFFRYIDHLRENLQELLNMVSVELRGKISEKALLESSLALKSEIERILSGMIFMRKFLEAYDSDREKIEEALKVVKERIKKD